MLLIVLCCAELLAKYRCRRAIRLLLDLPVPYSHQQVSAIEVCSLYSPPSEVEVLDSFVQKPKKSTFTLVCIKATHTSLVQNIIIFKV